MGVMRLETSAGLYNCGEFSCSCCSDYMWNAAHCVIGIAKWHLLLYH